VSASAEGGIKFGSYVLLRRIARGGMAEVFLAQQKGLEGFDRRVAVKRILPHLADAPDFVKMFLGEARLAAQLTHPNVVHIYDFGKFDGDYFIAMEYVEGVHAGQLFKLTERERLPPTMIARLGADAATALHYAHELRAANGKPYGLVHRDVSPANLMVSFDGVVKLCDFGIAKAAALGDQLTNPGQVKGKYAYMSPEQTIAAPLDGRSDVYSLAIVLWELLVGKTIVPRGDAVDAMRAIRDGRLTPIEKAAPWVPPALVKAITWALQTKRDQRATAMDFAQALEAFIKSSPELATPMQVGAWVRQRFPRDNSGAHPAIQPGGGTQAAHGTMAAPGTVAAPSTSLVPRTRGGTVTPASLLAAATTGFDDAIDTAETIEITNSMHTGKGAANAPTLIDDGGRAGIATTDRDGSPVSSDEHTGETVVRSGAFRQQVPGGPVAVPTRVEQRNLELRPTPAPGLDTTLGVGRKADPRTRKLLAIGGLVALAVVSFLIALAARPGGRSAEDRDAGAGSDAARLVVIPIDAAIDAGVVDAPADAPLDAREPTIRVDAAVEDVFLTVTTKPSGGTVRVGDQVRKEPAKFALAPGKYALTAELDGYKPEKRDVEMIASVDLVQEIAFDRKTSTTSRPPPQLGKLTARTTPYSVVFNGGKRLGETPFADLELPAGTYTLSFRNPQRAAVTRKVTITSGKTTKLSFALP
jgi:hypothetical protein